MRHYDPTDKYDKQELKKLHAKPWQVTLLALNPHYCSWGPHEDYMMGDGKGSHGWDQPVFEETFDDYIKSWELNDLNELVNFYFELRRENVPCTACDRTGLNPASKAIQDAFYDFEHTGQRWRENITQDEVEALVAKGRLWDLRRGKADDYVPTAEEVNQWSKSGGLLGHDAINQWILVETRCKRLGVWGKCDTCKGEGYVFTEPDAHVALVLWVLHPRKGCSRGVEIKRIAESDLPGIFELLRLAARRNAERFGQIPQPAPA